MIEFVSTMKRSPLLAGVVASLLSVVFTGCGGSDPVGSVEGKVLLNEAVYTDAAVVFLNLETGQAGAADIQSDGTFHIENSLPVGMYTVYLAPKAGEDAGDAPTPETFDRKVPGKYWSESTSDIKIEITEGDNDVMVPLKRP